MGADKWMHGSRSRPPRVDKMNRLSEQATATKSFAFPAINVTSPQGIVAVHTTKSPCFCLRVVQPTLGIASITTGNSPGSWRSGQTDKWLMGWIRWRLRPSGVVCSLLNSASVRTCSSLLRLSGHFGNVFLSLDCGLFDALLARSWRSGQTRMGSKPGNRPSGIALLRRPEPGTAAGGAGGGSTRPPAADSGAGGGASRTSMARRGRGTGRWATGPGGIGGRLPLDVRCGRELELEFWGDNGAALLYSNRLQSTRSTDRAPVILCMFRPCITSVTRPSQERESYVKILCSSSRSTLLTLEGAMMTAPNAFLTTTSSSFWTGDFQSSSQSSLRSLFLKRRAAARRMSALTWSAQAAWKMIPKYPG
mmetsp:Transcript_39843/g.66268  ORF Transcript_39843/g.66268 Transcript_39843/m.66268 type:complete len:364 (+) Transcript_39843:278-1369(+)